MLAIAAVALMAAPAHSQEPTIVEACLKAASFQLGYDDLETTNVQSFPELSPPRVRMDVHRTETPSGNRIADILNNAIEGSATDDFTRSYGEVRCEFDRATPPFELSDFHCSTLICSELYIDPELKRRRLEELQTLMAREGY